MAPIDDAFLKLYGEGPVEKESIAPMGGDPWSAGRGQSVADSFLSGQAEPFSLQERRICAATKNSKVSPSEMGTQPSQRVAASAIKVSPAEIGMEPQDKSVPQKSESSADLPGGITPSVVWVNPVISNGQISAYVIDSSECEVVSRGISVGPLVTFTHSGATASEIERSDRDRPEKPGEQPEDKRRVDVEPGPSPVRGPHFSQQKEPSLGCRTGEGPRAGRGPSLGEPSHSLCSATVPPPGHHGPGAPAAKEVGRVDAPDRVEDLSAELIPAFPGPKVGTSSRHSDPERPPLGEKVIGKDLERPSPPGESSWSRPHCGPLGCQRRDGIAEGNSCPQRPEGKEESPPHVSGRLSHGPHFSRKQAVAAVVGAEIHGHTKEQAESRGFFEPPSPGGKPYSSGLGVLSTAGEEAESAEGIVSSARSTTDIARPADGAKRGSANPEGAETSDGEILGKLVPAYSVDRIVWPSAVIRLSLAAQGALQTLEQQMVSRLADGCRAFGFAAGAPGQGTTTLLLAMAKHFLSQGQKVGVVDAAFHHPVLCQRLGVLPEVGWEQMISGALPAGEVTIRVEEVPMLIIPWMGTSESGLPRSGSALLPAVQSDRISQLLQAVCEEVDLTLVDLGTLECTDQKGRDPRWLMVPLLGGVVTVWDARRTNPAERERLEREILAVGGFLLGEAENFAVLRKCA